MKYYIIQNILISIILNFSFIQIEWMNCVVFLYKVHPDDLLLIKKVLWCKGISYMDLGQLNNLLWNEIRFFKVREMEQFKKSNLATFHYSLFLGCHEGLSNCSYQTFYYKSRWTNISSLFDWDTNCYDDSMCPWLI